MVMGRILCALSSFALALIKLVRIFLALFRLKQKFIYPNPISLK